MKMKLTLLLIAALCVVSVKGGDDDNLCYDEDSGRIVRTSDCPHSCCVNSRCGSSSDCRAIAVIIIAIIGSVVACIVLVSVAICYFMRCCCFTRPITTTTAVAQPMYPMAQPMGAYPPPPASYPPQQPVVGYPLPPQAPPPDQNCYMPPASNPYTDGQQPASNPYVGQEMRPTAYP